MQIGIAVVKIVDGKLVIEIDTNDLLNCVNNHPEGFKIVNEEDFMKYVENHLTTFNESEDGCTPFYRLFDDLVVEAYEGGEEFVRNEFFDEIYESEDEIEED